MSRPREHAPVPHGVPYSASASRMGGQFAVSAIHDLAEAMLSGRVLCSLHVATNALIWQTNGIEEGGVGHSR